MLHAAIVSAALAKVQSIPLEAAVERVVKNGPCDFSPKLWSKICRLDEQVRKTPSMPALNLIVIRSLEPKQTVHFYELLGLRFQEEQHGNGPVHWAGEVKRGVVEVYPAHSPDEVDGATRLGFEADDVESVLALLRDQGAEVVSDLKQTQWGLRAVIKDPDGRSIELVQK